MSTGQADSRNTQREYQWVSGLKMAHPWRYQRHLRRPPLWRLRRVENSGRQSGSGSRFEEIDQIDQIRYSVQTISRSATMIARNGWISFSLCDSPAAAWHSNLHLLFGGGVSPVQEPRTDAAGRRGFGRSRSRARAGSCSKEKTANSSSPPESPHSPLAHGRGRRRLHDQHLDPRVDVFQSFLVSCQAVRTFGLGAL